MRTTLTIDDDIARELEARMRRESKGLKEIVNELLRAGLAAGERPRARGSKVKLKTFSSPFAPGIDAGKLNELNDELEIEGFLRKHERGET